MRNVVTMVLMATLATLVACTGGKTDSSVDSGVVADSGE